MYPIAERLVLDIGNSRTKVGLFSAGRLVRHGAVRTGDLSGVQDFLGSQRVENIALGAVTDEAPAFISGLQAIGAVSVITGRSPSHLRSDYATQATLGVDRWANAVGASLCFPGRPVLAISLGTCATYDLVGADGTCFGGIISPGMRMRARAMHEFTSRLPLVDIPEAPMLIGSSTAECLASGAHHGLRSELRAVIADLRQQHPGLVVVLTGGDALRFARALENGIFAHPFLTLFGLYALSLFDRTAAGPPDPRQGR